MPEDRVLQLLCDGPLQICRLYLSQHGRVPHGLIDAILAECDRYPVWWQIQFYNTLLREYPDLCGLFLDADDDDADDDGPAQKQNSGDKKRAATVSQMAGLEHQRGYQ